MTPDPPANRPATRAFAASTLDGGGARSGAPPAASRLDRFLPWIAALVAVLVTLPALTGEFVWDDRWLLLASPLRQDPSLLFQVAFEGHGWGTMSHAETVSAYFRPLANLIHGALILVFDARPLPFRLLSTLLHGGCALALALLLRRRHLRAAWGAVLFAAHPVAADAFGWISAAPDTMAAGFLLAAFLALERPRPSWVAVGILWLLALLSKESALVGLLWIPLLAADGWRDSTGAPRSPDAAPQALASPAPSPFAAPRRPLAAIAVATLAYIAIRAVTAGFHKPLAEYPPGVGPSGAVLVGRILLADLQRLLWPIRLTLAPPNWAVAAGGAWSGYAGLVAGAAVAVASLTALRRSGTNPATRGLALGTLLCLAALLPVIQIVPTNDLFGGRFLYLPLAGLCLGLGVAFAALSSPTVSGRAGRFRRDAVHAVLVAVLCALAFRSGLRASEWRSDETLFGGEYRRQPDGLRAEILWAGHLLNEGRIDAARSVVESLTAKHPENGYARYLRALVLMNSGRIEEAAATFEDLAQSWRASPTLLSNLASCQMRLGRLEEGLATLDRATERMTPTPGMRNNRGLALKLLGRHNEARSEFENAIAEDPSYEPARVNLISLLVLDRPDPSAARRQAEEFLRRFPESPRLALVRSLLDSLRTRADLPAR